MNLWFLAALAAAAAHAGGDEFGALPGLWKTTTTRSSADGHATAAEDWHCVDEAADPWVDYARLPDPKGSTCTRDSYERTSTSLKWKLSCSAPAQSVSEGAIVFDSPLHYTGTVHVSGSLLNYPVDDTLKLEGQRRAACTSPSD